MLSDSVQHTLEQYVTASVRLSRHFRYVTDVRRQRHAPAVLDGRCPHSILSLVCDADTVQKKPRMPC